MRLFIPLLPLLLVLPLKAENKSGSGTPARVEIDATLDAKFFHETQTAWAWHIVEKDDGSLEDSLDQTLEAEDLLRVEQTSDCYSSHQGRHLMPSASATATPAGINLLISGGLPAYSSSLEIKISGDGRFQSFFQWLSPAANSSLSWKITGQKLKLKTYSHTPGRRLYGWVSVSFDELDSRGQRIQSHVIEGFIKPVICHQTAEKPPSPISSPTVPTFPKIAFSGKTPTLERQ